MKAATSNIAPLAVVPDADGIAAPNELVQNRVKAVQTYLSAQYYERDAEVYGLIVAALAGEHILLLGPPGTGKSAIARSFAESFDQASYFEWLLTKFSVPEELFGPLSLSGLKSDEFRRVTKGKLPEASIAFLDEIFKANAAIQNSLLSIINERVFHDNGKPIPVPLLTCVAASNEMPESVDLAAFWDRFVIRYFVGYTKARSSFAAMLQGTKVSRPAPLTMAEWAQAQREVSQVVISPSLIDQIFQLRNTLASATEPVVASDRRWVKAAKLVRAAAWLDGRSEAMSSDLRALIPCLWNTPAQIETVRTEIVKIAGREVLKADELLARIEELKTKMPASTDGTFVNRASSMRAEMKRGYEELKKLHDSASDSMTKRHIKSVMDRFQQMNVELSDALRVSIGLGGSL